jgi:hypothetical protein
MAPISGRHGGAIAVISCLEAATEIEKVRESESEREER